MAPSPATAQRSQDNITLPGDQRPPPKRNYTKLRQNVDSRLQALDNYRYSWWTHWAFLAEYILPRRYRWLITENAWMRGKPINQAIIDSTGTMAARTLAAGMMSGTTSPARPWFRLTTTDEDMNADPDVKIWLDDTQARMMRVMASSNYYVAKAMQYMDLVVFGTAPMLIYEDYDTVIRCYNPCAGEYYAAVGARFSVDTLYRKFTMTIAQIIDEFGYDACSMSVKSAWDNGGTSIDREVMIAHAIEPNPDYLADGGHIGPGGTPRQFKFREVFWEYGQTETDVLRIRGYMDQPFSCPRWDVTGNDAYGRSPGMDALGDIKQLQLEQKRKAQAIDKMVNPPMLADMGMKNQPATQLPGGVTFVNNLGPDSGFRPAFIVNPHITEMMEDIREVQERIKNAFFTNLFMMISNLDTVRTATEIDARREEQLIQLGPVLERNEAEGLSPDIKRIFGIMNRNGLLMKAPASLNRAMIKVEYISMLAEAQRASSLTGIERLFAFVGNLGAAYPGALDKPNVDEAIDEYADKLRVSPKLLNSDQAVQAMRAQRAQQQAQQQAQQDAGAAVQGAQTLSDTDVGGGQNALQMMLQGAGGGSAQ